MRTIIIKWLRYYFGISRTEANGVVVLVIIMIAVSFLPLIVPRILETGEVDQNQQRTLDSLASILDKNLVPIAKENSDPDDTTYHITYFSFDPNTTSIEEFQQLGLTPEIANRIIRYREKGGTFYEKEDLKKIYGLSESDYNKLYPHISIPKEDSPKLGIIESSEESSQSGVEKIIRIDMNDVDSSELIIVNGIGKVLAARIVKYRESLGGFVKMEQLGEVYGLESYAIENIQKQGYIMDSYIPRKILINKWPIDSIARHPYIGTNKARVIVAYREQHGLFENTNDLLKILVLDESWLLRISPYLEF